MPSGYGDAERRILAALVLNYHRPDQQLIDAHTLETEYSTKLDAKLFDAVVANLDRRGLILGVYEGR